MWGNSGKSGWLYFWVKFLSRVQLFAIPLTVAHQAPWSMGFSRHEYWSGLPFPSPGDLPHPEIKTHVSCDSYIDRLILYHWTIWEALIKIMNIKIGQSSEKGVVVQYQVKISLNHIIKNMTTRESQQKYSWMIKHIIQTLWFNIDYLGPIFKNGLMKILMKWSRSVVSNSLRHHGL